MQKFDIYKKHQDTLIDHYLYTFDTIEILRGNTYETSSVVRNLPVQKPIFSIYDVCYEKTNFEVGKTYLIIGDYLSRERAKQLTDPRMHEGNWYIAQHIVLLEGYLDQKTINEQPIEIKHILKEYIDIINN